MEETKEQTLEETNEQNLDKTNEVTEQTLEETTEATEVTEQTPEETTEVTEVTEQTPQETDQLVESLPTDQNNDQLVESLPTDQNNDQLVESLLELKAQHESQLALGETALETERSLNEELREEISLLLRERDEIRTEIQTVTRKMTEKVEITDQYIRDLLAQLHEGQEKYDNLKNERCLYCPWTWIRSFASEPNWMYGLVGLLVVVGGSRVIGLKWNGEMVKWWNGKMK